MDLSSPAQLRAKVPQANLAEVWDEVCGLLRNDMSRKEYENYVLTLRPLGCEGGVLTLGTLNSFTRDWAESRLSSTIRRLASGLLKQDLRVELVVLKPARGKNGKPAAAQPALVEPPEVEEEELAAPAAGKRTPRKVALARAYGSKRAAVIQPERGMFLTLYFFSNWLPIVGHSAAAVILAARSMCFWNPITGELRDTVETEMAELAARASVSVRTVKAVLKNEDVRRYFLRYTVRRRPTEHGVRTDGITLKVRMDDPLTPQDQQIHQLEENLRWYSDQAGLFDDEDEDE